MKVLTRVLDYIKRSEQLGTIPNFYLSEPYLELSGAVGIEYDGWIWIEGDAVCVFPPLPTQEGPQPSELPVDFVWSDFANRKMPTSQGSRNRLDWEYIYNPGDFLNLSGSKWMTFRKNIHKWPRENPYWGYTDQKPQIDDLERFVIQWLEDHSKIEDSEVIAQYVLDPPLGVRRKFIYSKSRLAGINVWDWNWAHINYRFILCNREPFLDEFARWLFYTDSVILTSGKPVNDGGTAGNPGLERFKDKLNPIRKREVFSWTRSK